VQKEGKKILVADSEAEVSLDELDLNTTPLALVFGNEHEGVSPKLREAADGTFCIPMCGFAQSLNVSVAAAVVIAALRKDGRGSLSANEQDLLRARFYLRAVRAGYDIVKHEQASQAR
jgi:tRNA (guanosine-2'-O-)-methyltransferase